MFRLVPAVLACVLMLMPVGARAADLVVWWEKGAYAEEDEAVREIMAAFEHKAGKRVELVLGQQEEFLQNLLAAIEAGRPPPTSSFR